MTQPLIEARAVSKSFRLPTARRETLREHLFGLFRSVPTERLDVLQEIDLELRAGEVVGIMGRNGSGKSTLLKVLCGVYRADSGAVAVRAPITPILSLGIGWNNELDAVDNILVLATVMGVPLREAKASVDDILAFAGLEKFANMQVKHYSSGMAARLTYAVAFRTVREVLILDEIFAVGDAGFRARCEERYAQLIRDGYTLLMVSHDPKTVEQYCTRALLLEGGRVALRGTGEEVAKEYLRLTARAPGAGVRPG